MANEANVFLDGQARKTSVTSSRVCEDGSSKCCYSSEVSWIWKEFQQGQEYKKGKDISIFFFSFEVDRVL